MRATLTPIDVMAGLVPAIHAAAAPQRTRVDARHEAGHDGKETGR